MFGGFFRGGGVSQLRRWMWAVALLVGLGVFGLGAQPASAFLLDIRSIHVTQGTQTVQWDSGNAFNVSPQEGNTLSLVSGRSTAVRVLADLFLDTGELPPANLLGRLTVLVDGSPVFTSSDAFTVNAPWTPPVLPQIQNEADSLNFEIPPGVIELPDGRARGTVTVAAFVGELRPDGSARLVDSTTVELEMIRLRRPTIVPERVTYTPFSNAGPDEDLIAQGRGDSLLTATVPIVDDCSTPFDTEQVCPYQFPWGAFDYAIDTNSNGLLDFDASPSPSVSDFSEVMGLIGQLDARRNLLVVDGGFADETTFVYGWIPQASLSGHNGASQPGGGNVAYGNDSETSGQGSFAHEFVHMHGLVAGSSTAHNQTARAMIPDVGWDVGGRLVSNPAGNAVPGRVRAFTIRDIMNNEFNPTNNRWLDATTYAAMLAAQPRSGGDIGTRRVAVAAGNTRPCRTVTVSGGVTRSTFDKRSRRLKPVEAELGHAVSFPNCGPSKRRATRSNTQLIAEVIAVERGRARRFRQLVDARVLINRHLESLSRSLGSASSVVRDRRAHITVLGPFSITVPYKGVIREIRLRDRSGKLLDRVTRSASRPALRAITPARGARLRTLTRLRWTARDADTRSGGLLYHVAYSANGGRDFLPVAANVRGRSLVIDSRELPPSKGQGVLRVYVSDGVNSRFVDVRDLTNTISSPPEPVPPPVPVPLPSPIPIPPLD